MGWRKKEHQAFLLAYWCQLVSWVSNNLDATAASSLAPIINEVNKKKKKKALHPPRRKGRVIVHEGVDLPRNNVKTTIRFTAVSKDRWTSSGLAAIARAKFLTSLHPWEACAPARGDDVKHCTWGREDESFFFTYPQPPAFSHARRSYSYFIIENI